MIEIQDSTGEWCQYDETGTVEQIAESLRASGFIGSVTLRKENGEVRGWVSISDEGDVDWRAQ